VSPDAAPPDLVTGRACAVDARSGAAIAGRGPGVGRRETRVWLRTLRLENFRNYERLEIEFEDGLNFLFGPNGSGKTSILEAVSYLAVARSIRGAGDGEVVRWGASGFGVGGDIVDGRDARSIVLRFARGGAKGATVDGEGIARLSDLLGHLRVAWFGPEDTWLTKGGPEARRRLIDMTLCQIDHQYLAALSSYRRILKQRNEALLGWSPDDESERVVQAWTEQLLEHGSRVITSRLRLVPRLEGAVARFHAAIAMEGSLSLEYRSSVDLGAAGEPGEVRSRFAEAIEASATEERRRGFTQVGPHRDDLEVRLDGRLLRAFGSQGQHRTAAIALKLGEADVLDDGGRGVVVLLDDILSELDEDRGRGLVELVGGLGQALMTSTRAPDELVSGRTHGSFLVHDGEVSRQ
jgi:DNA replication and repair protein RecF